ncbi:superoxide dismutase family protein [Nocardioides caldifontis]|uniref:superoxide dismutase family protein n=1 Tax=Nocardioides caldifontis TaxID=2588938 RepID=UPI0011DF9059|nr:superoxide dismutase family protein [Nocardioides caldifontis]
MRRTALLRHLPLVAGVAAVAMFVASPAIAGSDHVRSAGPLVRWSEVVPAQAEAVVTAEYDATGRTTVVLRVEGLRPGTVYGAHVHEGSCGSSPEDAGPTYQNVVPPDPDLVSTPRYANRHNEVWLDVETDASGAGSSTARVTWQFPPHRRPGSVVLHEDFTSTGLQPGPRAGVAGDALACLDVEF